MRNMYFRLDEGLNVVPTTLQEWCKGIESRDRIIAQNIILEDMTEGGLMLSTVFLGLEHGLDEQGKPLVFETMILTPNSHDVFCQRYATYAEAKNAHETLLEKVRDPDICLKIKSLLSRKIEGHFLNTLLLPKE